VEIALVSATAAIASLLTFFTGFGLATILTPVMLVFFPAPVAIVLTAIVHFLNNLFKYALMRTHIEWRIVISFGLPAGVGALIGAGILFLLPSATVFASYSLGVTVFQITAVKLLIGTLMVFFALFEAIPRFKKIQFATNKIYIGGLISGFFGGLSGHQGALRSAFLVRVGLTKEVFIATGIAIACIVDATRLVIYRPFSGAFSLSEHGLLLVVAVGSAFAGALAGNLLLKKTELKTIQWVVALGVVVIGLAMAAGLI
jgi:uncharacterized protein